MHGIHYQMAGDEPSEEVTPDQLAALVKQGRITEDTLIYMDKLDCWKPYHFMKVHIPGHNKGLRDDQTKTSLGRGRNSMGRKAVKGHAKESAVSRELAIAGRGNGVLQLAEVVDDAQVMFGLMRFDLGSGTFARQKYIFLHVNGENAPRMARMRHNQKKAAVMEAMGGAHGTLEFANRYEITSDVLMEFMLANMVTDGNTDYESTAAAMRAALEEQMKKKPAPKPRAKTAKKAAVKKTAGSSTATHDMKKTLVQLHKTDGTLNFMLVDPNSAEPSVIAAGNGSLPGLIDHLDDTKVLYALVRMNFGSGRFRRSKLVFIHFIGDSVSAVKRGRWNAKHAQIMDMVASGSSFIEYTANGKSETDPSAVIDFISHSVVTDNGADGESAFSVEAFMKALTADAANITKIAAVEEDEEDEADSGHDGPQTFDDMVVAIRGAEPEYTWMLCSVND